MVVLKQNGPWTYGGLANHLWDFAGSGDTSVNSTYIQPFLAYTLPSATTFTANIESTYNWQTNEWNAPLNLMVSQVVPIKGQPVQFFGGVRYYIDRPTGGADWGMRFGFTLMFPKS